MSEEKQVVPKDLKIDYIDVLDQCYKSTSSGNWYIVEDDTVETVWISSDDDNIHTVALFDYNGKAQNLHDANFLIEARNNIPKLLKEIKYLRERVLSLLKENTKEVNIRISLQKEIEQMRDKSQGLDR